MGMTNQNIQNETQLFFEHFREFLGYVRSLPTSRAEHPQEHKIIAQKLLCCSLLDALAITRFDDDNNKDRFKKLVTQHTSYPYWDRVSVPQILYYCEKHPQERTRQIEVYARSVLANRNSYSISEDPTCDALTRRFPDLGDKLDTCTHASLLYKYRNKLVHEMRQPGYGYEFGYDTEPCYRTQTELETNRFTFQLTYPFAFFVRICNECISSLETYFLEHENSPYIAFENRFGDVW
jgi:hypothetical protein